MKSNKKSIFVILDGSGKLIARVDYEGIQYSGISIEE